MTSDLELITFTAVDRCDRCGAQAYHLARKPGFSDLLFCKHHLRETSDALLDSNWKIISDAESLEDESLDTIEVKY